MSALALCLCSIERQVNNQSANFNEAFFVRASHFARIGSGSAARSVFGGFVGWGKTEAIADFSDETAAQLDEDLHPVFKNMRDTILLISKGEKKVSSRAGHSLMDDNPYAAARYRHATENLKRIITALKSGDMVSFIEITENEALTLHAMMMASNPGFILMEQATLAAIEKIRNYRQKTGTPVCFTLDAGPNIHVLYPESAETMVKLFIQNELLLLCENNQFIDDKIGSGPINLTTDEKK
jgi:diphosphomevalonate decarboxylase